MMTARSDAPDPDPFVGERTSSHGFANLQLDMPSGITDNPAFSPPPSTSSSEWKHVGRSAQGEAKSRA